MTRWKYAEPIAAANRGRPAPSSPPLSVKGIRVLTAPALNRLIVRRVVEATATHRVGL